MTERGFALFILFLYQIAAAIWLIGGESAPVIPYFLLFGFYAVSFAMLACHGKPSLRLSLAWRLLFAANLAFFLFGVALLSNPVHGSCVPISFSFILGTLLSQYWPLFFIRKFLDPSHSVPRPL